MTDAKVTRRHRDQAAKLLPAIYQAEDPELREWIESGDEDAGKWWICDCSVGFAAQHLAKLEAETTEARTCLLCKHCSVDPGFGGSEVTPASGPDVNCAKELMPYTRIEDLVEFALVARSCSGFELMEIPK